MKFLKRSGAGSPRVSLILLDWSVRESFHMLDYLSKQTVSRDRFEVIVVEFYATQSAALARYSEQVDTWLLLEMPPECYYHKHLLYNAGIVSSRGQIVVIADSDTMVRPTFIERILRHFDAHPGSVFHMDQFRNMRRDFYPFNHPSFEDVTGRGCVNNSGGKPSGLTDRVDPIHARNYGACMCAPRADLIAIGGADEHLDFLGYVCGPYDLTFRLVNIGRAEFWADDEFTYHTWHPGQAGEGNYLGPHDGHYMSTTSLNALIFRRVLPLQENPAIHALRSQGERRTEVLDGLLIDPENRARWLRSRLEQPDGREPDLGTERLRETYKGTRIYQAGAYYRLKWICPNSGVGAEFEQREFSSLLQARRRVDAVLPIPVSFALALHRALFWLLRLLGLVWKIFANLPKVFQRGLRTAPGFLRRQARQGALVGSECGSVIVCLSTAGATNRPLVLTSEASDALALRILSALHLMPSCEIQQVRSDERLDQVLEASNAAQRDIFVLAAAFVRHYATFRAKRPARLVVI